VDRGACLKVPAMSYPVVSPYTSNGQRVSAWKLGALGQMGRERHAEGGLSGMEKIGGKQGRSSGFDSHWCRINPNP
jgi:hypothetical protein